MGNYLDGDEHVTLLRQIPESFNETNLLSNLYSMAPTFISILCTEEVLEQVFLSILRSKNLSTSAVWEICVHSTTN